MLWSREEEKREDTKHVDQLSLSRWLLVRLPHRNNFPQFAIFIQHNKNAFTSYMLPHPGSRSS